MIAVSIELSDEDMALLLRLAANSGTTASGMAARLFRAELDRQARLLKTARSSSVSTDNAAASVGGYASASPHAQTPAEDYFAYLDTSVFALDSDALKQRFEHDAFHFDAWWNGLPVIVRDGVQRTMRQSAASADAGQLVSASGLFIRMRE